MMLTLSRTAPRMARVAKLATRQSKTDGQLGLALAAVAVLRSGRLPDRLAVDQQPALPGGDTHRIAVLDRTA